MLATALAVSPPNVTGIVERMVEQGLITREENPQNRRMLMLKVTEKGDRIATEIQEHGVHKISGLLTQLSLEDLQALTKGFTALVRTAEEKISSQETKLLKSEA
jgi:DNA-binding MarR family transcriptional regulator